MPRLLHGRYLVVNGSSFCDLATGGIVGPDAAGVPAPSGTRLPDALIEVLDHGRDGMPRVIHGGWFATIGAAALLRLVADEGQQRGLVPVAVEVYERLGSTVEELCVGRTLLLLGGPRVPERMVWRAFLAAAASSSRPHVLCICDGQARSRAVYAREARPVFGAGERAPLAHPLPAPGVARHLARAARAEEFIRAGRHAAAARLLRDVAGALSRRRASRHAGEVLLLLGQLLLDRGRAGEAEVTAGDAAREARAAQDDGLEARARIQQALARTDLGQLTAAESICRALLATSGRRDPAIQAEASSALARVLLWQNRLAEASEVDLGLSDDGSSARFAALVTAVSVRVLVATGRLFEAGVRLAGGPAAAGLSGRELVMLHMARLRLLAAAGDLDGADRCVRELTDLARRTRLPLAAVRARVLWADTLRRAGQSRAAERQCAVLRRLRRALPPLLRLAVDRTLGHDRDAAPAKSSVAGAAALAARFVRHLQDGDDDRDAVSRVLHDVLDAMQARRIDLWSSDAGPASIVLTAGAGPATTAGPRVLEAGITVRIQSDRAGAELGMPVRLGSALLGAVVSRWTLDTAARAGADDLLGLAAAVIAPRVDGIQAAGRAGAQAAVSVPELLGESAGITALRRAIVRAAPAPFAVLIEGESGVGKELVARALHQLSPRRERRFCDINCAALPDDLLEAELFGHARGAFTGAVADRPGLFESADGGTVFLDEAAELSPRAQAKLLRVLQQQEVRRVGEAFSRRVDVRIVSAANRDMRREVAEGRFRQDLLYRLDVIRMTIPPLRERPEDVPLLAEHFWRGAAARVGSRATLGHAVLAALARYPWPGNVRELQNVLAALAVAAPSTGRVPAALLPQAITGAAVVRAATLADARTTFERRFVEAALARAGGSRSRAARDLGLSRQGLLKTLRRLGIGGTAGSR